MYKNSFDKFLFIGELIISYFSSKVNLLAPRRVHVLIQGSGKKEDPKDIEPLGILYGNLLRPTRLPTRKQRSNVSNPIRAGDELQNKQIKAMNLHNLQDASGFDSFVRVTTIKK